MDATKPKSGAVLIILKKTVPAPSETKGKVPLSEQKLSVETKVHDMIDCIESGHNSSVEWIALNKFYNSIKDRKDQRSKDLRKMIEPCLSKYGQHGVGIR